MTTLRNFFQSPFGRLVWTVFLAIGVTFVVLETVQLVKMLAKHLQQHIKGGRP
jgi:hypothetical protein